MAKIRGLLMVMIGLIVACSGGGSGAGEAGNQAALRLVNVTGDIGNLSGIVDGQILFPQVLNGQFSEFESVAEGLRLIELSDNDNPQRKSELSSDFAFSIPYTLLLTGGGNSLTPILAANDRSDTPQAQFRIRAINASGQGDLSVRLVAGSSVSRRVNLRAEATVTARPTVTPQVTLSPVVSTPVASTPVASTPVALTPVVPTLDDSAPQPVDTVVASGLDRNAIGDYLLVNRGDYVVEVSVNNKTVVSSGKISYQAGQVETLVISGDNQSLNLVRLNDKP